MCNGHARLAVRKKQVRELAAAVVAQALQQQQQAQQGEGGIGGWRRGTDGHKAPQTRLQRCTLPPSSNAPARAAAGRRRPCRPRSGAGSARRTQRRTGEQRAARRHQRRGAQGQLQLPQLPARALCASSEPGSRGRRGAARVPKRGAAGAAARRPRRPRASQGPLRPQAAFAPLLGQRGRGATWLHTRVRRAGSAAIRRRRAPGRPPTRLRACAPRTPHRAQLGTLTPRCQGWPARGEEGVARLLPSPAIGQARHTWRRASRENSRSAGSRRSSAPRGLCHATRRSIS